eukprot:TRINITY_DN29395_c0_g1_i1.p1 TRINITY_DN29395_c0_g1~~TRINITY_DN29395_c0_g1_i1.p1  ORF type:complete len:439 (-),score=138.08 TRINITY_DN29395_c0_g1_i1:111-1427(-)
MAYRRQYGHGGSVEDQDGGDKIDRNPDIRPRSQPGRPPGAPVPRRDEGGGIPWGKEGRMREQQQAQRNAEWKAAVQKQIEDKAGGGNDARQKRPAPIPDAFTRPTSQERRQAEAQQRAAAAPEVKEVRNLPNLPSQLLDQPAPVREVEKWLPRKEVREANPQLLHALMEPPRNAEEVVTKVAACGTALGYLADESTRMRDDMEQRFRRMEQALVHEAKAHTEQVMESRREAEQIVDVSRRLREVEILSQKGEEKGDHMSGQSAAIMQEVTRLDARIEQIQQVGMQQATALNRDLSEFENNLMGRINLPEVAAVQAELRARLTESEGHVEQLRVMATRQQEVQQRQEDATSQQERQFQVEMEQRNAVMRQLIDDKMSAVQQRTDTELKVMLRELAKIQDANQVKAKESDRVEERDRSFSERRLVELEQALEGRGGSGLR